MFIRLPSATSRPRVLGFICLLGLALALLIILGYAACVSLLSDGAAGILTSPAIAQQPAGPRRPAGELTGGTAWLNCSGPVTLADLRGHIVLLDFWTLCCINCMHVLPDLDKLEAKYPGILVIIGIHTPKFHNEKLSASIRQAILRYHIQHPVVNDADSKIWRRYRVNGWPTLVLIDPDGNYYGDISGEGGFKILDKHIGRLVKEFRARKTLEEDAAQLRPDQAQATPARSTSPARSWPTPPAIVCSSPTAPTTV